jgi:hypothetical protein
MPVFGDDRDPVAGQIPNRAGASGLLRRGRTAAALGENQPRKVEHDDERSG